MAHMSSATIWAQDLARMENCDDKRSNDFFDKAHQQLAENAGPEMPVWHLIEAKRSITGDYIAHRREIAVPAKRRKVRKTQMLKVVGAREIRKAGDSEPGGLSDDPRLVRLRHRGRAAGPPVAESLDQELGEIAVRVKMLVKRRRTKRPRDLYYTLVLAFGVDCVA